MRATANSLLLRWPIGRAPGAASRALRRRAAAALLVPLAGAASACGLLEPEDGRWRPLGLDGMWVTAVAETPWGVIAGTRDDGVFRLDSTVGRWQSLGLAHLRVLSMLSVPSTPPRLLVGVTIRTPWDPREATIYATQDGTTWTPADSALVAAGGAAGTSLAVDPGWPDRLYSGSSSNVLRSLDGGKTWHYVLGRPGLVGNGVWSIVISPLRDGTVWASTIGAIPVSTVLRSRDWGDTWEGFTPFPGVESPIYALAVDPQNSSRVWAGMDAGAIVTADGGRTWEASLIADYTIVSALVWLGEDLLAVGMYQYSPSDSTGDYTGDEISRIRLYRLRGRAGPWERIDAPSDVRGGRSAAVDSQGRLLVGTTGSGVWLWGPR